MSITVARLKNTIIMRVDFNETKQKSNWYADLCYRSGAGKPLLASSLWLNSISEREQDDRRGKKADASLFLGMPLFLPQSLHTHLNFKPSYSRSPAGSPQGRDGCIAVASQKARWSSINPALFSPHSSNICFSLNSYDYTVSESYLQIPWW